MCKKNEMNKKAKITQIVKRLSGVLLAVALAVCVSSLQAINVNADAKDTRELYPVVRTGMPVKIFCSGIGSASLMQDKLDQTKINIDISGIRQELFENGG